MVTLDRSFAPSFVGGMLEGKGDEDLGTPSTVLWKELWIQQNNVEVFLTIGEKLSNCCMTNS